MTPPRSLKARALQWLAQREQSRAELRRKLLPHARAEAQAAEAAEAAEAEAGSEADAEAHATRAGPAPPSRPDATSPQARVDAVLDWLEAHQHLSQERFVESRIHARAPRFGNLRIRQELMQHQVALPPHAAQALRDSELQRALAVRERKFDAPPSNLAERARQARFLAGRGFSPDVIARALRGLVQAAAHDEDGSG